MADPVTEVKDLVARSLTAAQAAQAKAEAGERSISDIHVEMEKRSAEINKLDEKVAAIEARNRGMTPATNDGPEAELKRRFARDGVNLFPVARQFPIGNKTHTEVEPGLLTSKETYGEAHREVKDLYEAGVVRMIVKGVKVDTMTPGDLARAFPEHNPEYTARMGRRLAQAGVLSDASEIVRVFGVSSGSGADLISSEVLMPEIERVAALIIGDNIPGLFRQVSLNDKNTKSPIATARPRPYKQGVPIDSTAANFLLSKPGSGKLTYTVYDLACAVQYDRNAEADAVVAFMPMLRSLIGESMMLGLTDAIFNSDTNATHQDSLAAWAPEGVFPVTAPSGGSAVGGDLDHRRSFLGLRARCKDIGGNAIKTLTSTWTLANIQELHGNLSPGVGQSMERTAIFASMFDILTKLSTITELTTAEKYGPLATNLRGQVLSIGGRPVVRAWPFGRTGSETGAFNTSGLHDATPANNSKSGLLMVDLDRYHLGTRQGMRLESSVDIMSNSGVIVGSGRWAFESPDHSSAPTTGSTVNAVYGYATS